MKNALLVIKLGDIHRERLLDIARYVHEEIRLAFARITSSWAGFEHMERIAVPQHGLTARRSAD